MSEEILQNGELNTALRRCPEWEEVNGAIVRTYEFEMFSDAIEFVNIVADIAESACHHPNIDVRYRKVKLSLVTHELGGITEADIELASRIDTITED